MKEGISKKTVYRLTVYNRCLRRLADEGVPTISSESLARFAGVKPTQIRKDLSCCGTLGKRGHGYEVKALRSHLTDLLHKSDFQPVVLIGAGNLGAALLKYDGFEREGFMIIAAFDLKPEGRGEDFPVPVLAMRALPAFLREHEIKMAILCVPGAPAQQICDHLVECGVQAILNFSPRILRVPPDVAVNNVNLAIELESLSYFVR